MGSPSTKGEQQRARASSNHLALVAMFAVALGVAALVHQGAVGDWQLEVSHLCMVVPAVVAILRPGLRSLLFLFGGIAVATAINYPVVLNHDVLASVAGLGVLIWALVRTRGASDADAARAFWVEVTPYLRSLFIFVYFVAAFSKLNRGFFDPDTSCAGVIWSDVADKSRVLPALEGWTSLLIAGTVAVEFVLPTLLVFRRTRLVGLLLGLAFHATLTFGGHAPYAGYALAFYVLFLPDDTPDRARRVGQRWPWLADGCGQVRRLCSSSLALVLGVGGVVALTLGHRQTTSGRYEPALNLNSLIIPGVVLIAMFAAAGLLLLWQQGGSFTPNVTRVGLPHGPWVAGLVVLAVLATSPYVGGPTHLTFTMWSNLRTEDGRWNHAVAPSSMKVFDLADDLVTIVSASEGTLARYEEGAEQVAWLQFVGVRDREPSGVVVYERDGQRVTLADGERTDALEGIARVMPFRPMPPEDLCQH